MVQTNYCITATPPVAMRIVELSHYIYNYYCMRGKLNGCYQSLHQIALH